MARVITKVNEDEAKLMAEWLEARLQEVNKSIES